MKCLTALQKMYILWDSSQRVGPTIVFVVYRPLKDGARQTTPTDPLSHSD